MTNFAGPPARFTFSQRALDMIATIKADPKAYDPEDPPGVLGVAWGQYYDNDGNMHKDGVVIGFYNRSQTAGATQDFYRVSGIPVLMGGNEEDARRFDGKVIDYDEKAWFFLRAAL